MLAKLKSWWQASKDYLHLSCMKYEEIPRHDDQPYLERWILFRCRWFGLMLHKFIGSDDECLHDHPWPFISFLISRPGYLEWVPASGTESMYRLAPGQFTAMAPDGTPLTGTWYPRWSLLFRPAHCVHRVETPTIPMWSLVLHGKKCQSWGFQTKVGWRHHSAYSYKEHCE